MADFSERIKELPDNDNVIIYAGAVSPEGQRPLFFCVLFRGSGSGKDEKWRAND